MTLTFAMRGKQNKIFKYMNRVIIHRQIRENSYWNNIILKQITIKILCNLPFTLVVNKETKTISINIIIKKITNFILIYP